MYIYIHIYIHVYTYVYIYIYIYIRDRALRVWCDQVFHFGFRLLLSKCLLMAHIRAPPNPHGRTSSDSLPRWTAFENNGCCYRSLRIFTMSLSGSTI